MSYGMDWNQRHWVAAEEFPDCPQIAHEGEGITIVLLVY